MSSQKLPPPFLNIPGTANFRDIGGYAAANEQTTRKGLVFRAADPTKSTEEGLKIMSKDLGIKFIYDLRSMPEIKRDGPEWADVEVAAADTFEPFGITRVWTPVFAEKDYGPDKVAVRYKDYTRNTSDGFVSAYRDITKNAPNAYSTIFKHLAEKDPEPCLVHCTAGKDRTGVLVAMLLMLAGVDDETIAHEYSLTDQGLAELKPIFIERLLKNPALEGNREGVNNMVSSKKENMLASLVMLRQEYEAPERYMRERCGLSDAELQQLKANLLTS